MPGRHVSRYSRVAVVGAGVIGCATAYYLARTQACEVVLIGTGYLAEGASGRSAGMLTPYSGSNDPRLLALSPRALELHRELAETLPEVTDIDHRYQLQPYLRCGFEAEGLEAAEAFMNARVAEGLAAEWVDGDGARELCPQLSSEVAGACVTELEPTLDSRLLTQSLHDAARHAYGAESAEGKVVAVSSDMDGELQSVRLEDGTTQRADAFVFALGPWTRDLRMWLRCDIPVEPQRGQLLHVDAERGDNLPFEMHVGLQNMDEGGTVVPRRYSSIILGATREDDAGFDVEPSQYAHDYILPRVQRMVPAIEASMVSYATACLRPKPADGKPYVGVVPGWDNVYVAAGHWSEGIHYGPLTGKWLADDIVHGVSDIDMQAMSADRLW